MQSNGNHTPESLAREHDALANMQGAEARRVDVLVNDVGTIKGTVENLRGDVGRVGAGVEQLQQSMTALNRHSLLLEGQQATNAETRQELRAIDARVRTIELDMPSLKEARSDYRRVVLAVLGMVGLALLALVIKQ